MGTARRISGVFAVMAAMLCAVPLLAGSPKPPGKPQRIVSLNLCVDQLLVQLVPRGRIAALTDRIDNPTLSPMAGRGRGIPQIAGHAEEVIAFRPDLILASTFSARTTVGLLRQLGYRVETLPVATTFEEVRTNVRRFAELVGEPEAGARMIADFDRRLAAIKVPDKPAVAALYWARGSTSGGGTLIDLTVRKAGFRNLSAEEGFGISGKLPLETLLVRRPDAIIMANTVGDPPSLATEILKHPALARVLTRTPGTTIDGKRWVCGTPGIMVTLERLAAFRNTLAEAKGSESKGSEAKGSEPKGSNQ